MVIVRISSRFLSFSVNEWIPFEGKPIALYPISAIIFW
jgi:hypothetical protein